MKKLSNLRKKAAVLSLSGGMDSTSLLLNLIRENYTHIYCLSFDYGQKHKIELEKAKIVVNYLKKKFPKIVLEWKKLDLKFMKQLVSNSLTDSAKNVPEGFYNNSNMKDTVVENRNAIFSSIIFAYALNLTKKLGVPVEIAMGVHKGDHTVYPDTRPEFIKSALHAYQIGNWGGEFVTNYLPYIDKDKAEILEDALGSAMVLNLNFNFIFKNTNTSYAPLKDGKSEGKTGSDVERILAFDKLGLKDPFKYTKPWPQVLKYAKKQEEDYNKQIETRYKIIKNACKTKTGKLKIKKSIDDAIVSYSLYSYANPLVSPITIELKFEELKEKLKLYSKGEVDYDRDLAGLGVKDEK